MTQLRRLSILLLFLFVGACRSSPATETPSAEPTLVQSATPAPATSLPPTSIPTPFEFPARVEAREPVCEGAPITRLIVEERGRVTNEDARPLRMRSQPGTQFEIVAQMRVGEVFLVLEGPQCAEGYAWYRVRYRGEEGWIAEGDPEVYYVEPYLPG